VLPDTAGHLRLAGDHVGVESGGKPGPVTVVNAPERAGYTVRVARSERELEELRPAWLELQGSFVTTDPDYYLTVVRADPRIRRPHVVLFEREGRPELMIVGRIEDLPLPCRLGYKVVYKPTVRALTVVYGGFLGRVGEEEARLLVDELLAALAGGEAEVAHLPSLRAGSHQYQHATRKPARWLRHTLGEKQHWRLHLPESTEEFMRSRSPRTREGLRRQARRLEREYGEKLTIRLFRDRDQLDRLFADAERVAGMTYQWQLGVAFRDTPLQRSLTELGIDKGWFRAYLLYLEDRPVAFWHGLGYAGIFRTGVPAYDPSLATLNVGTYVLVRLIADLCADDSITELDYGFGDAEYKRRLGEEHWLEDTVLLFASSPRAVGINLVVKGLSVIDGLARRLLGGRELTGRVKRAWRRRLAATGEKR